MRPNFTEKNNIRTMYLQIPCQTLSVFCMEIGGRVKLSENVHNIWISARKPVVCPQTRYRTRRNIIPKFLKNAMKTLFAFCVFNNGGIYLSIPRKAKTCMLFRSNAHKNSRNFSCVHHYFFCSHHGWTLYLARSKVNTKISRGKDGIVSWLVRGLQCARSQVWFLVTSRPCFEFNFSPFCVALTSFKYP